MSSIKKYDCIVIGSGQAGTPLAGAYAKAGRKTALVERIHIGGCCTNEGCTPTKTMVASGRAAYLTRRGADYGVHTPGGRDGSITVDMLKVRQRKRDIVEQWRGGNESRTHAAGVEVLMGEASFTGPKTVQVEMNDGAETLISAETIFINTGERPSKPKLAGLDSIPAARVLDSTSIMELDEVPSHLLVLGGGYVGLEFGQLFRRLGAQVTIVQRARQLLTREDPEVAECMRKILVEDGIDVHLEASAVSASPSSSAGAPVELTVRAKDGSEVKISGSHLLSAAGRTPNTDMLNLRAAGISANSRDYIERNDKLETNVPGVYALGDVAGPPAFTHISYDDFRIIRDNVLEPKPGAPFRSVSDRQVPYVVYTDPQLGHVGLHLQEVPPERKVKTASMPMSYVARALETDEPRGMMKAVVDAESGEILGFSCLGIEGGELMAVVQTAMKGGVKWQTMRDMVWAHPSIAESLNNLWSSLE